MQTDYKYLGNFSAVEPWHSVSMHCDDCRVEWTGCWDNFECPVCRKGDLPWHETLGAPQPSGKRLVFEETAMRELIEALEMATGPSSDLDGRIYCAINGLTFRSVSRDGSIHFEPDSRGTHTMVTPQPFTQSIDKAATLVPEGICFRVGCETDLTPSARLGEPTARNKVEIGATPAIALCIAALKARASQETHTN